MNKCLLTYDSGKREREGERVEVSNQLGEQRALGQFDLSVPWFQYNNSIPSLDLLSY